MRKSIILLICLLSNLTIFAQPKIVKEYSKKDGLCGQSLKLYSDDTYLYEFGCEGRSFVNFGKWVKEKHKTVLYVTDTSTYNPVLQVKQEKVPSADSSLTIKIIDRYDRPVKNFVLVFVPQSYGTDNRIKSDEQFIFLNKSTNEIEFLSGNTSNGNGNIFSEVRLAYNILVIFPTERQTIIYDNTHNNLVTIKLNLSKDAFLYPDVKWFERESCEFKGQHFEFRKSQ